MRNEAFTQQVLRFPSGIPHNPLLIRGIELPDLGLSARSGAEISFNAANGNVHFRQTPGGGIAFLPEMLMSPMRPPWACPENCGRGRELRYFPDFPVSGVVKYGFSAKHK